MTKRTIFILALLVLGLTPAAWCSGTIQDGVCLTHRNGGIRLFENYEDLKREGVLLQYFPDGEVAKIFGYENNERHGFAVGYYPNQAVQYRIHFQKGIKNGPAQRFYPNGNLAVELTYRDGKPDGIAKYYTEEGTPEKVELYSWGTLLRVGVCDAQGRVTRVRL